MIDYPCGFDASVHSKKPICGVLAVALCAGVSYPVAHAACKASMKALKLGVRFGGRTWLTQIEHSLKGLAVRFAKYRVHDNPTVGFFAAHRAEPGVTYLLRVKGHFVTLRDGMLIDQISNAPWQLHKTHRRHVTHYLRIDGKGW